MNQNKGIFSSVVRDSISFSPRDAHLKVLQFLKDAGTSHEELEIFRRCWSKVHATNQAFGRSGPSDPGQFANELIKECSQYMNNMNKVEEYVESVIKLNKNVDIMAESKKNGERLAPPKLLNLYKTTNDVENNLNNGVNVSYKADYIMNPVLIEGSSGGLETTTGEISYEESIIILRGLSNTMKIEWKGKERHAAMFAFADGFIPLQLDSIGWPEYTYGTMKFKNDSASNGFQSNTVIALRVSSNRPYHTSRAWDTYSTLHGFVSARHLNCFSLPISAKADSKSGTTTVFTYEYPQRARSMACYLGSFNAKNSKRSGSHFAVGALAVFLRKYSSAVIAWCAQLGATYRAMVKAKCCNNFMTDIDLNTDVWIRDNGLVLIGNGLYLHNQQVACPEQGEVKYDNKFVDFMKNLLVHSLCLSRDVSFNMIDHRERDNSKERDNKEDDDEADEGDLTKSPKKHKDKKSNSPSRSPKKQNEIEGDSEINPNEGRFSFALSVGSEIVMDVDNIHVRDIHVDDITEDIYGRTRGSKKVPGVDSSDTDIQGLLGGLNMHESGKDKENMDESASFSSFDSILYVRVVGREGIIHAEKSLLTSMELNNSNVLVVPEDVFHDRRKIPVKLRIKGLSVGTTTLEMKMQFIDPSTGSLKTFVATVTIKVLSTPPMSNTDCAELVELLESSYITKKPLFLRAQAFRKPSHVHDESVVASVWDTLVKEMRAYQH